MQDHNYVPALFYVIKTFDTESDVNLVTKSQNVRAETNSAITYNLKKLAQQTLIAPDRNVHTFVYVIRISAFKKTDTVISE